MIEITCLVDISGSITLIGEALTLPDLVQSATVWRISRVVESTSGTTVTYADNVTSFTKQWSARSTYSYTVS